MCPPQLLFAGLLAVIAASAPASANEAEPFPGLGTGRSLWIDAEAGDDWADGSAEKPWKTLDRLERAALLPGDVVNVRAGRYELDVNLRLETIVGSADAWIGIRAAGPVEVVGTGFENVVDVVDCHYLVLQGLSILHRSSDDETRSPEQIDGVKFRDRSSDHVALVDCTIRDLGGSGISAQVPEIRGVRIQGCDISRCQNGIYLGYFEEESKRYAHETLIAGNVITDCPPNAKSPTGYGIQIKGGSQGNVIEDNLLLRVGGTERAGIAVYHASDITSDEAANFNIVRRNRVIEARHEGIYASEAALIENNVVADAGDACIEIGPRDTGKWGRYYGHLIVRHNTLVGVQRSGGRTLRVHEGDFEGDIVIANNLLMAVRPGRFASRIPVAFAGTVKGNRTQGAVLGGRRGFSPLADAGAFRSLEWGNDGFAQPLEKARFVGTGDPDHRAGDDCNEQPRPTKPTPGAFEPATD